MQVAVGTLVPRDLDEAAPAPAISRRQYGPAACLVWVTFAAALIDFGDLHRWHQADSFVPVLQSIYRWEMFYWEQNRYGMLVALLASPVRHPFHNLLVQNGLTIWLGLMSIPLAVRFLRGALYAPGDAALRNSWRDGLIAAGTFALVAPSEFRWLYLSTVNIFGTSLALGLAGLIVLERSSGPRLAAAVLLFGLSAWTNTAIGALLFFLIAGLLPLQRRLKTWTPTSHRPSLRRRVVLQAAFCVAAVAFGLGVLGRIPPPHYRNTHFAVPSVDTWVGLLQKMTHDMWVQNREMYVWILFTVIVAAAVCLAARLGKTGAATSALLLVATFLSMCAYSCAMGILFEGRWRYSAPAMVLAHAAAVAALTARFPFDGRRAAGVLPLVLLAAIPLRHGIPSYDTVRTELQAKLQVGCVDVVDARCTHVAGDYWNVWPAVFGANWRLYEEGGARTVWGLAHRSLPTEDLWRTTPLGEVRAATFEGDLYAERYLNLFATEWTEVERRGPLVIQIIKR